MGVVATDALMLFVLASASPARTRLLTDAGVAHVIRVSDIDEQEATNASGWVDAHSVAGGLATAKARDVAASLGAGHLVLGCDSVFDIGGEIHGKPADAWQARQRWERMRGGDGILYTGHHVIDTSTRREITRVAASTVYFADPTDEEIDAYIATGEPLRVAGGVTIDALGAPFISRIDGDHSNVMGLSIPTLRLMLMDIGIAWPTLWTLTDRS
jgi:septum formation protein